MSGVSPAPWSSLARDVLITPYYMEMSSQTQVLLEQGRLILSFENVKGIYTLWLRTSQLLQTAVPWGINFLGTLLSHSKDNHSDMASTLPNDIPFQGKKGLFGLVIFVSSKLRSFKNPPLPGTSDREKLHCGVLKRNLGVLWYSCE